MVSTVSDYFYATVAYADIFAYPLTDDDIYFWFVRTTPKKNIRARRVRGLVKVDNFTLLRGRKSIVSRQKHRAVWSRHKWQIARSVGRFLRLIPTVNLVGVTGGLAMRNSDRADDIDFFIITAPKTLWVSRLLTVILLDALGTRRKPGARRVSDKVCLNMFMSEDALTLPRNEQDLFAAHEVLQMEPLWSRGGIYKKFLSANNWVKTFLPVAWHIKQSGRNMHPKETYWWSTLSIWLLQTLELPAKYFQLWYMRRRLTVEKVTGGVLRFHPQDARAWVRREYARRLSKMNIPLDNIFYAS